VVAFIFHQVRGPTLAVDVVPNIYIYIWPLFYAVLFRKENHPTPSLSSFYAYCVTPPSCIPNAGRGFYIYRVFFITSGISLYNRVPSGNTRSSLTYSQYHSPVYCRALFVPHTFIPETNLLLFQIKSLFKSVGTPFILNFSVFFVNNTSRGETGTTYGKCKRECLDIFIPSFLPPHPMTVLPPLWRYISFFCLFM